MMACCHWATDALPTGRGPWLYHLGHPTKNFSIQNPRVKWHFCGVSLDDKRWIHHAKNLKLWFCLSKKKNVLLVFLILRMPYTCIRMGTMELKAAQSSSSKWLKAAQSSSIYTMSMDKGYWWCLALRTNKHYWDAANAQ
jgi:hypothetical protein